MPSSVPVANLQITTQDVVTLSADLTKLPISVLHSLTPSARAAISDYVWKKIERDELFAVQVALMTTREVNALEIAGKDAEKNRRLIIGGAKGLRSLDDLTDEKFELLRGASWQHFPKTLLVTDTKARLANFDFSSPFMWYFVVQSLLPVYFKRLKTEQIRSLPLHRLTYEQTQFLNKDEVAKLSDDKKMELIRIQDKEKIQELRALDSRGVQALGNKIENLSNPIELFQRNCNYFTDEQWKKVSPYIFIQNPSLIKFIDPKNIPKLQDRFFCSCPTSVFAHMNAAQLGEISIKQKSWLQPPQYFAIKGRMLIAWGSSDTLSSKDDEYFSGLSTEDLHGVCINHQDEVGNLDNLLRIVGRLNANQLSCLKNYQFEDDKNCSKFIAALNPEQAHIISRKYGLEAQALGSFQPQHAPDFYIGNLENEEFAHFSPRFALALIESRGPDLSFDQIMNLNLRVRSINSNPSKPIPYLQELALRTRGITVVRVPNNTLKQLDDSRISTSFTTTEHNMKTQPPITNQTAQASFYISDSDDENSAPKGFRPGALQAFSEALEFVDPHLHSRVENILGNPITKMSEASVQQTRATVGGATKALKNSAKDSDDDSRTTAPADDKLAHNPRVKRNAYGGAAVTSGVFSVGAGVGAYLTYASHTQPGFMGKLSYILMGLTGLLLTGSLILGAFSKSYHSKLSNVLSVENANFANLQVEARNQR